MLRAFALSTIITVLFAAMPSCRPEGDQVPGSSGPMVGTEELSSDLATVSTDVPLPPSTIERLAQLTIDNGELTQFFHEKEIPARVPLIILLNDVIRAGYNLSKFDRPVVFKLQHALAKDEPFFEITKISVKGVAAQVEFRYPPEGLAGKVTFLKGAAEDWSAMTTEIVER